MGQTNFTQFTGKPTTSWLSSFALLVLLICGGVQGVNAQISVATSVTNVSCSGGNDGTVTAQVFGGWPPYTYAWSTGDTTQTITGLTAGTYTVTVQDMDLAIGIASGTVFEPAPLGIILQPSATCGTSGGSIQSIVFQGMPPYTYNWSDGQTTPIATGLISGTYTLTVTDDNGCTAVESTDVSTGTGLNLFTTASYETCIGSNDATATVVALNGTAPFTYLWSDGQTTDIAVGLSAGTYTVTVTDALGCQSEADQVVEISPEGVWIMLSSTDAFCGESNGTAHVSPMTGQAPYMFLWSNGDMTADPTGLAQGTYTVTVTDVNGCSAIDSVDIEAGILDPGSISTTDSTTFCVTDTIPNIINVDSTGNNAPNFLFVITDANGIILDINDTGIFDLTNAPVGTCLIWGLGWAGTITGAEIGQNANDIQGCFALTDPITVNRIDCNPCDVEASISPVNSTICKGESVDFSATVTGGTTPFTYAWTASGGSFNDATSATPTYTMMMQGTYTIRLLVTDANGCEAVDSTSVTVEAPDAGTLTIDANPVCLQNGMANLSATPNGDAFVPPGYETIFVLTSGTGLVIEQVNATPSFVVTDTGNYTIHTLVYNPATLDLSIVIPGTTTGFDVNSLLVQGGGSICASLDVMGAPVNVFRRLIGDFVWIDENWDGYQNSFEKGFEGATVKLLTAGPDGVFGTPDDVVEDMDTTDANGFYLFECALPGEYIVSFEINNPDYTFTTKDATLLDGADSDVDTLTGNTDPITITSSDGDNLTIDAGVHLICVNYTYPGRIAANQTICIGTQPALLTSLDVPSGGFGPVEYLWMYSTEDPPPADINQYIPFPNSNSPDFQPGPLFDRTFIRRCARSIFCTDYVETDELVIDVVDCAMAPMEISAKALFNGQVELNWNVLNADEQYNYYIERRNPKNFQFETIQMISGNWPSGDVLSYSFIDQIPHVGRNFYRIKQVGLNGSNSTDIIEVSVGLKSMKQILTYPNPAYDEVIIRPVNPIKDEPAIMQIFDITGKLLQIYHLAPNQEKYNINIKTFQSGAYILRIQYRVSGVIRTSRILKLD